MTEVASQVDISRALAIGGWMSENELIWLATNASHCSTIVEFGSLHGRSTRALADNASEGARIWAVDPWGGKYMTDDGSVVANVYTHVMPYFKQNLRDHISIGRVIPVRNYSHRFELDEKVDMVFIDGDHRFESCYRDIVKAKSLLKPGGLLCGHDYKHPLWPGVELAIATMNLDVEVEQTIWWTRKF